MNPLVSVIIPNYNHAKYLNERIQSVVNQTYKNFEVIIFDDCSKDNSIEIIENYKNNPKIKHIIYNKENSGSTFIQWNKGFDLAQGDYIWIAESDDVADDTFLEKTVKAINKNPNTVLVFTNSLFIDSEGKNLNHQCKEIWNTNKIFNGEYFTRKHMLGMNNIYNASAVLFKKDVIINIPREKYINYKACGDRIFWIYVCLQGNIVYLAEKLNKFRKHDNKVSPKAAVSGLSSIEDFKIYSEIKKNVKLNLIDRILISGFHYGFIHSYPFDKGVKPKLDMMWKNIKEYSFISYCIYKITRKLNFIS